MWKSKMIFVNIIIVLIFTLGSFVTCFAVNANDYVKIGIKYGKSSVSSCNLKSSSGFEVLDDNNNVIINMDDKFLKATGDEYHIKVENAFSNLADAKNVQNELCSLGMNAFIYYDGNYYVYIDSFNSSESANEYLQNINNTPYNMEIVNPKSDVINLKDESSLTKFAYDSSSEISLKSANNTLNLDNVEYRGYIILNRDNTITIINKMLMDEYLYGVVPREMSSSWPIESLKAQAVAARNYTLMNMNKHSKDGFNLCTSTHCQVYGGYKSESARSNKAVDDTSGVIMTYNGEIVDALYHSNSGGRTENSENIWSGKVDYLRGVEDSYSIGYPNDNWSVTMSSDEIENKLAKKNVNIGDIVDVRVSEVSENSRVLKLDFIGTKGQKTYTKDAARSVLGLKSTWFDVSKSGEDNSNIDKVNDAYLISSEAIIKANINEPTNIISKDGANNLDSLNGVSLQSSDGKVILNATDNIQSAYDATFVFTGHGWGHGVGMSQWGAKKMAELGMGYEQILKHYYTGVQISN